MKKINDKGPMRVPDDERRVSGPIIAYKLTSEEIEKIFRDIKPEKTPTGLNYMFKPKQKKKEDLNE